MRKVIFDSAILRSEQPMAEMMYFLQVQKENFHIARELYSSQGPSQVRTGVRRIELYMNGLLEPPKISNVELDQDEGVHFPLFFISTAKDVGSIHIFVSVWDDQGHFIESSSPFYMNSPVKEWGFTILESLPSDMPINISVRAIDCVGGVRVKNCRFILP